MDLPCRILDAFSIVTLAHSDTDAVTGICAEEGGGEGTGIGGAPFGATLTSLLDVKVKVKAIVAMGKLLPIRHDDQGAPLSWLACTMHGHAHALTQYICWPVHRM